MKEIRITTFSQKQPAFRNIKVKKFDLLIGFLSLPDQTSLKLLQEVTEKY